MIFFTPLSKAIHKANTTHPILGPAWQRSTAAPLQFLDYGQVPPLHVAFQMQKQVAGGMESWYYEPDMIWHDMTWLDDDAWFTQCDSVQDGAGRGLAGAEGFPPEHPSDVILQEYANCLITLARPEKYNEIHL